MVRFCIVTLPEMTASPPSDPAPLRAKLPPSMVSVTPDCNEIA
jgi:hypothetical protein